MLLILEPQKARNVVLFSLLSLYFGFAISLQIQGGVGSKALLAIRYLNIKTLCRLVLWLARCLFPIDVMVASSCDLASSDILFLLDHRLRSFCFSYL